MTEAAIALQIRAAEPEDAAALSALIGSEGVFEGTSQLPMMPVASRLDRFSKLDPAGLLLVACTETFNAQQKIVGMIGLHLVQPGLRRAHVRGLGISVAKNFQGQGVGQLLMEAALHWADNWAGILRVELTVFADNARAIALYERHGFVHEGTMRGHMLRDGIYADTYLMARLHPNPPSLPRA
ncbi:GNAT family N-acetyltransferase [Variovorax sp. PCZ-1]|uniref:GNAT family N-acetyltransferase n=1 Tax=Variovorax sp. PCZ-1 TaxID=2835533 RepID=UPI001BCEFC81|nr:GNAT family N-acetyltransferase [Variovorax sp. PCZ-1]MBS7806892.1 GNAT family N-acetyltransferase [Variovorax sp. PCZ-1]